MKYNYAYNAEEWELVRVSSQRPELFECFAFTNEVLSDESALTIVRALNSGEATFAQVIAAGLVDATQYGYATTREPVDLEAAGFVS
jgi:hypothetical protein